MSMSALANGGPATSRRAGESSHTGGMGSSKLGKSSPRDDKAEHTAGIEQAVEIREAASVADIYAGLAALHARESALSARAGELVAAQGELSRSLGRLDNLRAGVGAQAVAARAIGSSMLSGAADTAARLSGRVRALDLEKQRVEDTLRVVEQVAELKACVAGVVGSMGAPQDWEAAAGYMARAEKVPDRIVRGGFAAAVVPTVEVPDPPAVTLEAAKESLCGLFLREFDKAVDDNDGARITRFFKLFPLIGRGDVGLDVYGRYVCQGVAGTARAVLREAQPKPEGFLYANALTKLFEHIAQIVDGHGSLVERHYGVGKMVRVVERLQMEADVQGGIILDSWSDERALDRRLTDVKSYPFSFLVQSVLTQQKGFAAVPRVNSPALGNAANPDGRNSEDEGVNMKDVDGLLSEIAVMLGRWSLYTRFLAGKCKDPQTPDASLIMPAFMTKSNLHQKVSDKLTAPYEAMSLFFFRRSVEKAFQLDEQPSGLSLSIAKPIDSNAPYIISAIDDVMYIVNAVIQKTLSTSQRAVVTAVIPMMGRVLGSDFITMIQRKMRDEYYPRAAVSGGFPPEDKIISFIVLINSLDMANEYLARIVSSRRDAAGDQQDGAPLHRSIADSFPFGNDASLVASCLQGLHRSFTSQTSELLNTGLQILFNQVVKLRLRPVLTDAFRDADYTLSQAELADVAQQNDEDEEQLLDQVPRRFEHGWDAVMKPIGRLMTPRTFGTLQDMTAQHLARVLEKRVWSYAGRTSAYGAIRMERDFSGIISAVARGNYAVREVFSKTIQVLMVANMEEDEWDELDAVDADDAVQWILSDDEKRRARNLVRI